MNEKVGVFEKHFVEKFVNFVKYCKFVRYM